MKRLARGIKRNDPRIYRVAKNEAEASAKVADIAGKQDKLNFLLRRAAYHNDLLTAKQLLENGADPNSQNLLGEGPMVSLCQNGSVEMLKLFLKHGASLDIDKFGTPPLIHAVDNGRKDLVREMLQSGANVEARETDTLKTALHRAVSRTSSGEIVELLLAAGADPRTPDLGGRTVLDWARLRKAKPQIVGLIEQAMKEWKDKPLPPKPKRQPKTALRKAADKLVNEESGEIVE